MEVGLFTIKIYKNNSSVNSLNKSITLLESLQCEVSDEFDIYNPEFLFDTNALITGDYVYCNDLNKYYYILTQKIKGNFKVVSCTCDYLMSYKQNILNGKCIALRSSSHYNMNIIDPLISNNPLSKYYYLKFPYTFAQSGANIIMQIGGNRNA